MADALAIINRAIAEHRAISEHIKLTGEAINDMESLMTLQRAHAGWAQSSIEALVDKQNQMRRAISVLAEGLKNHFGFEERAFPPLFGELLMKALLREHDEVRKLMKGTETALVNMKLEGLEQRDLLSEKSAIQETINHLIQAVEGHAHHEEIILDMMKRALEEDKT